MSKKARAQLGYYVYALVDPQDCKIFYVGKASGDDRAFQHLRSTKTESRKQRRIADMRAFGREPEVEVLRHGLESEAAALEVEAAIIDAIGLENLTNAVRGHGVERGRLAIEEVERRFGARPVNIQTIDEFALMFFIHRTFSPTMSEAQIYDCTRGFWHNVSASTRSTESVLALAVVESVVVRVYRIAGWYPAGTTLSSRSLSVPSRGHDKWEFVGQLLSDHSLAGKQLVNVEGRAIPASQKGYQYVAPR